VNNYTQQLSFHVQVVAKIMKHTSRTTLKNRHLSVFCRLAGMFTRQ